MADNYADDFLKMFEDDASEVILNQSSFNLLKSSILNWLNIKKALDRRLEIRLNELEKEREKMNYLSGSDLRTIVNNYTALHRKIKEIQDINDITEHFKKGFQIIERAREMFTGQKITYSIMYSNEDEKGETQLYKRNFTIDELLPLLGLTMNKTNLDKNRQSLTNGMNIYISGSRIAQAAATAIDKEKSEVEKMVSAIERYDLWKSLLRFRDERYGLVPLLTDSDNKKGTLRDAYTVYMDLVNTDRGGYFSYIGHIPGMQNTYGLAGALLDRAISSSIPFYQGGNYQLEQLKIVLGKTSTQRIFSVRTIEEQMQKLYDALQSSSKQELTKNIKQIFTPEENRINSIIEEKNRNFAIKKIDEVIKQSDFDIK